MKSIQQVLKLETYLTLVTDYVASCFACSHKNDLETIQGEFFSFKIYFLT